MQTVLSQLNSLPGVVGSMVCTSEGKVLAQAFPAIFEPAAVQDAARVLVDGAQALGLDGQPDDLLDLRFRDVRLLARPFSGSMLAVLCSRATNVQLLALSLTAAVGRLSRALQDAPAASRLAPAAAAGGDRPEGRPRVAIPAKGLEALRKRLAERDAAVERPAAPAIPPRNPSEVTAPIDLGPFPEPQGKGPRRPG